MISSDWHISFQKGKMVVRGTTCSECQKFSGKVARVFESEAAFRKSHFYGGGDVVVNDPIAQFALWPGKTNVGRKAGDYWLCVPVHPNCGCELLDYAPGITGTHEGEDWFSKLSASEIEEFTTLR